MRFTLHFEACLAGKQFWNIKRVNPNGRWYYLVSEAFVDKEAFDFHQKRTTNSAWAEASKNVPRDYKTWVEE